MGALGIALVAAVIVIGLGGALTQLYPGPLIVLGAIAAWAVLTGGAAAWVALAVSAVVIAATALGKYVLMGRHLGRAGVPGRSLIVGGIAGVVGFFVIPVVGLPVGFTLGVYAWEWARRGSEAAGREAAMAALRAQGLAILFELSGCLVAVAAWIIALLVG